MTFQELHRQGQGRILKIQSPEGRPNFGEVLGGPGAELLRCRPTNSVLATPPEITRPWGIPSRDNRTLTYKQLINLKVFSL